MRLSLPFISASILLSFGPLLLVRGCPNQCSRNGECNTSSVCECFAGFAGADCSSRTCPSGTAWSDTATTTDTAHQSAVCSNRGTCLEGECMCTEGFTGIACERTTCNNHCNFNGRCVSMSFLADNTRDLKSQQYTYNQWDGDKLYGCICDEGYEGYDCSLRTCPRGDDPLTTIETDQEVQLLRCIADNSSGGKMILYFDGKPSSSIPVDASTTVLKHSLETISEIEEVEVSYSEGSLLCRNDGIHNIARITFTSNMGPLPPLVVETYDMESSSVEAGSLSLATPFTGPNSDLYADGDKFGIVTGDTAVTIESFDIHMAAVTETVQVWIRHGNYPDYPNTNTMTKVFDSVVVGQGQGNATPLPAFDPPIELAANSILGVYALVDNYQGNDMYHSDGLLNPFDVFQTDDYISVTEGISQWSLHNSFQVTSTRWNGVVHYSVDGAVPTPTSVEIAASNDYGVLTDHNRATHTHIKGNKENDECSNRGLCQQDSGTCSCFDLYAGSDGYGNEGERGDCGHPLETISSCPGDCSGVGVCDATTFRCICQEGYTGADCSLRTCPSDLSWFYYPSSNDVAHHVEVECSNMGVCSRTIGQCQCKVGYVGAACQFMGCIGGESADQCSGHGSCLSMRELGLENTDIDGLPSPFSYGTDPNDAATWDADRIFGCLCDEGYKGYDCSLKTCEVGVDINADEDSIMHKCSNHGICDYNTGKCACFTGWVGNDCGHRRGHD